MSDAQDADDMAEGNTSASVEEDVEANVETALREFLDALGESETYRRFVEADEALQDDSDAMALLREYQRKQQMQRGGFDESVMAELKQLQTELSSNSNERSSVSRPHRQNWSRSSSGRTTRSATRSTRSSRDQPGWLLLSASDQDAVESEVTDDDDRRGRRGAQRGTRGGEGRRRSSRSRRW